jgi:hypothetical protein
MTATSFVDAVETRSAAVPDDDRVQNLRPHATIEMEIRSEAIKKPPLEALESPIDENEIDEFVRARGYDPVKLSDVPEQERATLMRDASMYASVKLSEIESRSHFVDEIHDGTTGTSKRGP